MGSRQIPPGCRFWPETGSAWTPENVVRMYESGFAGAWRDDEARERVRHEIAVYGGQPDAEDATRVGGIQGLGEGKLSLTYPAIEQLFPGSMPGPAQERGDCVSHGSKNAALTAVCNEVVYGRPDEVTGFVEGAPEVPADGVSNGVLSTEYLYWFRGYNGDGWDCGTAAEMIRRNGMMLRKSYAELGLDLTRYSGSLAGKYGAKSPPENITAEGRIHPVRTLTFAKSYEEVRDLTAAGFGCNTCGGEGFSSTRDENGVSNRRGSWSHAMAWMGVDDRQVVRDLYKTRGLILDMNSWGKWNSGPRTIHGTSLQIPEGSMWVRWEDVARREIIFYASVAGWKRKHLPDWGFSVLG